MGRLAWLILILSLLGPTRALASPLAANGSDFFPLRVGNWWVYRIDTMTVTETVVSIQRAHGQALAVLRVQPRLGKRRLGATTVSYIRTQRGLYLAEPRHCHGCADRRQLVLPFPPRVGLSWTEPASNGPIGHRARVREHFWIVSRGRVIVDRRVFANTVQVAYGTCPPHTVPSIRACTSQQLFFAAGVGQVMILGVDTPPEQLVRFRVR